MKGRALRSPGARTTRRHLQRIIPVLLAALVLIGFSVGDQFRHTAGPREPLAVDARFVRVVDGDTLRVGDLRLRLDGIASPEEGHPVYVSAKRHLARIIGDAETLDCRLKNRTDRYGRRVGACDTVYADGGRTDLQRAMVEAGFARACPGWGNYRYLIHENSSSLELPFPGYCWPG